MNFDNVQNWSIADGTVVRVTDSTENVIWEKKYNVWIADLTNIGFLSPHYVASKYAVNNDSDFIAFSTKNHPNDDNLTEIIRPTHINGTKLRFENIYGNPPALGRVIPPPSRFSKFVPSHILIFSDTAWNPHVLVTVT